MIFTQLRFACLVIVGWVSFFGFPRRYRPHTLAVWGLVFYGLYAGRYLALVAAVVLGTYLLSQPRLALLAVAGLAALLGYFKLGVLGSAVTATGISEAPGVGVLMPLGFSFLTFELIHFVIERRRGRIGQVSLVDLAAFAFYFPCRMAGPIKRFGDFTAAVARAEASLDNVYAGVTRILMGLVKKVVVADVLALVVAEAAVADHAKWVWKIVLAYSLQIFFDFSAYSDIAIGVSRLLGIDVPENFRWPYLSPNIREFWNRWHITLSSWVRDYVFLGLGYELMRTRLRRRPLVIAAVSYLVSFLVIGAWHGLLVNYLVWGAYHGVLMTGYYAVRARLPRAVTASRLYQSWVMSAAGTAVTFFLVSLGWIPFMTTLPQAWRLLRVMFGIA